MIKTGISDYFDKNKNCKIHYKQAQLSLDFTSENNVTIKIIANLEKLNIDTDLHITIF